MLFREVYDAHFEFVWRALRRLGVAESDARDAAQEVFVVVHRRLAEYEERAKMTTWLYAICYRVAQDRRRAQQRRPEDALEAAGDFIDERADVGAAAERRDDAARVERLLGELPLEQRAVLTMFEVEGFSGDEIAEILAIPVGTVHSRLRLARDAFRLAIARTEAKDAFAVRGSPAGVRARAGGMR